MSVSGTLQVVNGKHASPVGQSTEESQGFVQEFEASSKEVPQKKELFSLHGVYPKQTSPASHSSLLPVGHGLEQVAAASSQLVPQ
mmetsp:Transcript_12227/g.23105  ORF Transcript_12227/g.23105 Transcript_12227/m.23105 type:complete len:85 (-) Transcript_12227:440-694(-)